MLRRNALRSSVLRAFRLLQANPASQRLVSRAEQLVSRVPEIAPEIAAENGLAAPGDEIEVHVFAERVQSVPVVAAA
jgi:hypothetical protein